MTVGSSDNLSDMKAVHGALESPFTIRRFMDCENGIMYNSNKIHEKSEFKSYYPILNSNWKNQ